MKGKRPSGRDYPHRRNQEGQPLCRWCGLIVKPPRRSFCSDICVDEFKEVTDFSRARGRVYCRDRGICAKCHADTYKIRNVLDGLRLGFFSDKTRTPPDLKAFQFYRDLLKLGKHRAFSGDLWDADHVLEVIRGGTNHLDNLQTLCLACHKEKTKQLRRELAWTRRDARYSSPRLFEDYGVTRRIQSRGTKWQTTN